MIVKRIMYMYTSPENSFVFTTGTRAQRLWLLGDSFVRRAGERASWTGNHNLGVNASEVKWFGRGGLTLHEFPRALQDLLRYNPAPTIMIIHVGSNDLGRYGAKQCRQALDDALTTARELLPGCHIYFSSIIPRLFYYGYGRTVHSQSAIDKVRKSLNKYGRRKIRRMHNASFIMHNFIAQEHQYFNRDGIHLSDSGCDILIQSFATAARMAGLT